MRAGRDRIGHERFAHDSVVRATATARLERRCLLAIRGRPDERRIRVQEAVPEYRSIDRPLLMPAAAHHEQESRRTGQAHRDRRAGEVAPADTRVADSTGVETSA